MGLKILTHIFQPMQPTHWSAKGKKNLGRRSEHLADNAKRVSLVQVFSASHHQAETGGRQADSLISSFLGIVYPNHLWSSTLFSSELIKQIPDQLARSRGKCNWVNGALICPWNSVLAQEVGPSLSVKLENWPWQCLKNIQADACHNSEGILATKF